MPKEKKKVNRTQQKNDYQKEHSIRINLIFRNEEDADVINKIKSASNKSDYIRQLVLDDIAKTKQN